MPNIGGPSQAKRILLTSVVLSKILYAAPVWAEAATATAQNRAVMVRM
jgi:ABC-type Fe2+-enterobactin transport system substrate-binding protein